MSDATVLRGHLEGEVTRLHRDRRNNLIVSAILLLVVAGYITWIDRQVAYWSKPQNMATTAAGLVEAYIPSLKRAATDTITREAPQLARYVGDSVTEQVPGLIREMVSAMVTQYAGSLADFAVDRYVEAFTSIIEAARTDLAQAAATDVNEEQERLVMVALQKQMDLVGKKVEEGSLAEDPLYVQIEKSHRALANLNERLQKVIRQSDDKASRKDKLTKRFLGTFWRFVQQENPDVKASDEPKKPAAGK